MHGARFGSSRHRRCAGCFTLSLVAAVVLAACGGGDESGTPAEQTAAARTTAQPPPETAPEGSEGTDSRASAKRGAGGTEVVGETETDPEACPDVVITPDSGNGLFDIEADGITCEDAGAALEAWGLSGYPGEGPPGFACRDADATEEAGRLRCEQEASGAVVEFETGN